MSFTFENLGTNTYLVYEIGENDELDTMSLGMLTNNAIAGLAAASFTQVDTTRFIKYNVSAKVSVSQLFSGAVNKKRLIGVFSGIVDAMLSAEDYMLDTGSLLLDLDYIFADVSTCETVVVCLPVLNRTNKNPDLGMFFKNIIFNTQFDQTENCDHVAQILNHLNSSPVLSLTEFKELLERIEKTKEPVQPKNCAEEPARAAVSSGRAQQPVAGQGTVPLKPPVAEQPVVSKPQYGNLQFGSGYPSGGHQPGAAKIDRNDIPKAPQVDEEKPMSMFYLLQHYNKENAAQYKAQQAAKKAKKNGKQPAAERREQPKVSAKQAKPDFAVPGKQESFSPSFAVPGRQQEVPFEQKHEQPAPKEAAQPAKKPEEYVAQANYARSAQYERKSGVPANFGETTVLGSPMGETTVLGGSAEPQRNDPHLIRSKNNEKIPLNKPVFRIGKERSYVDYFIGDNTAISRSHANIVNDNGEFYIVDTNSTNHTYVNGGMIQSNVQTKLVHGTKIRLANEDFEFRMF